MSSISRVSNETNILLSPAEILEIATGIPMADHLLQQFFYYFGKPYKLQVTGDLDIDSHHTLEDIGYVLGRMVQLTAENQAIVRFGDVVQVMDEAAISLAVDLSGRGYFVAKGFDGISLSRGQVSWDEISECLAAMCREAGLCLHVTKLAGTNGHHIIEALFKGLGRVMAMALALKHPPLNRQTAGAQTGLFTATTIASENNPAVVSTKGKVVWEVWT